MDDRYTVAIYNHGLQDMRTDATDTRVAGTLPTVGFSRWEQLRHFIPVCRETWRKLVKDGRAPQPQRWTERCTVWRNEEIHAYLRDPLGYRADTQNAGE